LGRSSRDIDLAKVSPRCIIRLLILVRVAIPRRAYMSNVLVVSDPAVMMGKPVITGTRITVELILEKLAAGEAVEQILEAHPRLTRAAIYAALAFAAEALHADVVYPVAEKAA
jgi:uncharacterized protein (DUF433 family)